MKKKIIYIYICLFLTIKAGTVSDYIEYQHYLGLGMNRGKFKVGTRDVVVDRKDGSYSILDEPIPDFSSTDSTGIGTLVNPNYIASVKHNGGYSAVLYGYGMGHTYRLIDRNEHPSEDFHSPRLNKVVTDATPSNWNLLNGNTIDWFSDKNRYSIFIRVDSGSQNVMAQNSDGSSSKMGLSGTDTPEAIFGGNLAFRTRGD